MNATSVNEFLGTRMLYFGKGPMLKLESSLSEGRKPENNLGAVDIVSEGEISPNHLQVAPGDQVPEPNIGIPANRDSLGQLILNFHLPEGIGIGGGHVKKHVALDGPGPEMKLLNQLWLCIDSLGQEVGIEFLVQQTDDIPSLVVVCFGY